MQAPEVASEFLEPPLQIEQGFKLYLLAPVDVTEDFFLNVF